MNEQESEAERKQRLLMQSAPARVGGIADAVVIKDADLAFLCRADGSIPHTPPHGLGLYYHDCRFLSSYELRLGDAAPESLASSSGDGFRSVFQLTNPELRHDDAIIGRQELGLRWQHAIDVGDLALRDELVVHNYHTREHSFSLSLTFDADFADIFVIRGLADDRPGLHQGGRWDGEGLVFDYQGGDEYSRRLLIRFSEPPARHEGTGVTFDLCLPPQTERRLVISFSVIEQKKGAPWPDAHTGKEGAASAEDAFGRSISEWLGGFTRVTSSNPLLERVFDRSLRDLRALRMSIDGNRFFAAGVPWFMTLFGRDSLICGLQTLPYRAEIAAETLRLLARFQGRSEDTWRDEQPGKILHELRVGELARMGTIPHTPYYGAIDTTPLFLILLAEHSKWTGSLALLHELRPSVEAALAWMASYGDSDGDGYIDYRSPTGEGGELINQGWKDSGDAIVTASGSLARPPIALVEVQAYAYLARSEMAQLLDRSGEHDQANRLRQEAAELRARFNRDFWLEEKEFYALALHGEERQRVDVISSNPGHALWTGIVTDDRARRVANRMMSEDMYSGWGVRTLSERECAYNPVGYHLGTVWPHDNALAVAGLRRYGFDEEARRIFSDLLHAATFFEHDRLPEAFAGFSREGYDVPVRFPVACHPQAWAAGTIPFMLQALLGLQVDAFERRLAVVRPCLPDSVEWLRIEALHVGDAELDLLFERTGPAVSARVERLRGELDVTIAPEDAT